MQKTIEDACFILNPVRWDIISAITKGLGSATKIAKETGKSIAFIGQQLALLEANGFIKQAKPKKGKNKLIGKPPKSYEIAKEMNIIISIGSDEINMQTITPNNLDKYRLSSLMASNYEDLYFLQKLYYTHDSFVNIIQSVGIIESTPTEIHLLVISTNVETIRKEKSNITMTSPEGMTKTFILWAHTIEEVQEGLKRKEHYFIDKVTKAKQIWENGTTNIYDLQAEWEVIQGKTYKN